MRLLSSLLRKLSQLSAWFWAVFLILFGPLFPSFSAFFGIHPDLINPKIQDFGSGSGLDPDSIGPVDPDSESRSGSRRAKLTPKSRKIFVKVHVLKCWMASFES